MRRFNSAVKQQFHLPPGALRGRSRAQPANASIALQWTLAMAAMRGGGQPDVFPEKDLGLEKAWRGLPGPDVTLKHHAASWRPWRSYAANLLWRSLTP